MPGGLVKDRSEGFDMDHARSLINGSTGTDAGGCHVGPFWMEPLGRCEEAEAVHRGGRVGNEEVANKVERMMAGDRTRTGADRGSRLAIRARTRRGDKERERRESEAHIFRG